MQKLFFSPYKTIDTYLENLKTRLPVIAAADRGHKTFEHRSP